MKILVTGHKGFIGTQLVKRLEQDAHEIVGIDIKAEHNIISADFPQVDLVIHLAGIGGVRESMNDPKKYWDNNVEGTKRLLAHYQDTRVLFASSSSQYDPWRNPYAASKHVIEHIPHPNCVAMRFHTVYSDKARSGMFFDKLLQGKLNYVTEHTRDFVHVEDVCEAVVCLMHSDFKGAIDVCTGESVKISDIAPNLPIQPGMPGERPHTVADPSEMKKLGWTPKWSVKKFLDQQGFEHKVK
jgi:nucleoside-diphosphate-sugar epimerase